jgi:hypothetical protein
MSEHFGAAEAGTMHEIIWVGTPTAHIGCQWQRRACEANTKMHIQDIVLPVVGGEKSLAQAL